MSKKSTKKRSKKHQPKNNTKKVISPAVIISAIFSLICFIGISLGVIASSGNSETKIFKNAKNIANNPNISIVNATAKDVHFDPSFSDLGLYTITMYEFPDYPYMLESCPITGDDRDLEEINQQTKFTDFSDEHLKIIEASRNLVIQYINNSEVFTNKEKLVEGIKNIPFYLYTESTHDQLINYEIQPAAVHLGGAIYCNNDYNTSFCEYLFVHELVHHLRYLTSDQKLSNELYFATSLDETIADIIALSMEPEVNFEEDYISSYTVFYEPVYKYLNLFGRDALSAYFYGYDEFFEKNGGDTFKLEHNAFVVSLAYYDIAEDGIICNEGIYNAWNARF